MIQLWYKCLACSKGLLQLQRGFSKHAKKRACFCTFLRGVVYLTSIRQLLSIAFLFRGLLSSPRWVRYLYLVEAGIEKPKLELYLALTWSALTWQALVPAKGLTRSSLQDLPKLYSFLFVI